jgi:4-hydroxy-3-methylbut-2-enyl diphosphate reductase
VIGAANSSNSNRLVEVSESLGVPAYRVASAAGLKPEWFRDSDTVGLTAGASVPEVLVEEVVAYFRRNLGATVEDDTGGIPEDVFFPLPLELRTAAAERAGSKL